MKTLALTAIAALALCGPASADVSLSNKPTQNMSCDANVCTATAQKAVLNVGDLQTMLASGDVTVKTGSIAANIDINQALTWSSTSRLTLNAQRSVTVRKKVFVGGVGALTITTNNGSSGSDLYFFGSGAVTFAELGSSLVIDGHSYTLVGDIKTLNDHIAANPEGFYALANRYNASADGAYSDTPVSVSFNGTFEGLGNAITDFAIDLTGSDAFYAGLFREVDSLGLIRDFSLLRVRLYLNNSNCTQAGAAAAVNYGGLLRVHATGKIADPKGCDYVGGLVGGNSGLISRSSTDMQIETDYYAGTVGGLAGANNNIIDQSYSSTRVLSHAFEVGGLVGYNTVSLGYEHEGQVVNSYAVKHVRTILKDRGAYVGGLIGLHNYGSVSTSYSVGNVRARKGNSCGGLVGDSFGTISQSYWDSDTSQCGGAGSPLTDNEFKSQLPTGFDPKIWGQSANINNGYPYLLGNPPQ